MATKKEREAAAFRKGLQSSVLNIHKTLKDTNPRVCTKPDALLRAAQDLNDPGPGGRTSWQYSVQDLRFEVRCTGRRQPNGIPELLTAIVEIRACGDFDRPRHDRFSRLEVNIIIGCKMGDVDHLDAWHFDRHITNANGGNAPKAAHPLYHFQRGGFRMHGLENDVGRTLILEAPRIAHPPLDIILAVDFLVSNYSGLEWQQLRSNHEYSKTVKESQDIFWKPYAEAWSEHYSLPAGKPSQHAVDLIPALV